MARTLDEIIEEQGAYAQTPVLPAGMYSTPGWGPTMGAIQTPSQAELIRQATPTLAPPMMALSQMNAQNMALAMGSTPMGYPVALPPPPSPMTAMMAARAAQYTSPQAAATGAGLSATQGFLDPANASRALAQHSMGGQSAIGSGLSTAGSALGFMPGGQAAGLGLSLGGQWLGDQITNNAATRWVHRQTYGSAGQDLSNMAQLQHGTAGMMNLTGSSAGLGGSGMSAPAALKLGQRYRGMAQKWGAQNAEMAEQMGGGDSEVGMQRYTQDLTKLTQMAGEGGLLDAATNIDQIGDTVTKLFKVLGTMGKITGDPEFRNNLREIANMKQMGFTIDQAVNATRDIKQYANSAGMSRQEMMAGGGAMGQSVFANAGMVGGVGMVYGAHATMQAKQLSGAYSPMQEALLGGREGIAQRMTAQSAQFASGPMNMMLGAAMSAGPDGTLNLDSSKMSEMLKGGMSLSGLAGKSQGNMMRIARQVKQQNPERSIPDIMSELMLKQEELQSTAAQQLGPEGMQALQMQTISSLARPSSKGGTGMGLHAAASAVTGGDTRQTNMLTGMMSSPAYYEREKDRLLERLTQVRLDSKQERLAAREVRDDMRGFHDQGKYGAARRGYKAIGEGLSSIGDTLTGGDVWRRANAKEAENVAKELAQKEDEARGITRVHLGRTIQMNKEAVEKEVTRLKDEEGLDMGKGSGVGHYERLRQMNKRGFKSQILGGAMAGATTDQIALAQEARGGAGVGGTIQRWATGFGRSIQEGEAFFTGDSTNVKTMGIGGIVGQTQRTMDQTLEMASAVEETKDASIEELASALRRDEKILTEAGAKSGAIYAMQDTMLAYAERVGRGEEGKVLNKNNIRKHLRKTLEAQGVPAKEVKKILSDKNMKHWTKMTVGVAREFGTDEAKAALTETTDVADQFFDKTAGTMQEQFDTFQEKYEASLAEAGITEGGVFSDSLTTEEKIGLEGLQAAESAGDREAMVLMGILENPDDEDITDEMREHAKKKLDKMKMHDTATYKKARGAMKALKEKGGIEAVQTVGKVAKLTQKYRGGLVGLKKALKEGYEEGKGELGKFGVVNKASAEVAAMGGEIKDGTIAMPTESGVGTSQGAEIKVIEGQIANLDEMKKQFAGFGRSAKTLQIAAEAQIKAAEVMGGKQVAAMLKEWNQQNEK
jgi:hypothetical protein